jgi:hypothetical protein
MGIGARTRALRTGLVVLVLAFACTCGTASAAGQEIDLTVKGQGEIARSDCGELYSNPLNLLFLLPGLLFFVFALVFGKTGKVLFLFGVVLLIASAEPDQSELIRQAEQSFDSGQYEQALEYYRLVQSRLSCNSAVLYNLGVVSAYLDQRGYAIHYVRRSLRFAPADRQARTALRTLEQGYGLAGQVAPPFPVDPDLAYLLLLIFANLAFVLGAFVVRTRKVQFLISLVLVAIAALGSLAFFLARLSLESQSVGVVVSSEGELFRVPERDSKSWFELPAGTSLWIRGRTGSYYLVETPAQIDGWVRSDTILMD